MFYKTNNGGFILLQQNKKWNIYIRIEFCTENDKILQWPEMEDQWGTHNNNENL